MFMFNNARCGGCERVFCCSEHRCEHQLACEPFNLKRRASAVKKPHVIPTATANVQSNSPLIIPKNEKKVDVSRNSKRRHDSSGRVPQDSLRLTYNFLIQSNRKIKKATRGKFKKLPKIPTLEPVKEEDEEAGEQSVSLPEIIKASNVNDFIDFKPKNCDAYNDFIVGSLKESPITVIPTVLKNDKDVLATPTVPTRSAVEWNDCFKTSTPDDDSSTSTDFERQGARNSLLKRTFDCKNSHRTANMNRRIPKDTEHDSASDGSKIGSSYLECNARFTPQQEEKDVLYTPADAQPPKQRRFIRSRSSLSSSGGSTVYYSATSIISPLALESHPCTPVTNPSLFTSVKDVFRTFISRLPGTGMTALVDEHNHVLSRGLDSPARKRLKQVSESRLECRPTFKGRYKKPASYVFNS